MLKYKLKLDMVRLKSKEKILDKVYENYDLELEDIFLG